MYHKGKPAASTCCGVLGKTDPRPVAPDTLFCAFSVTKGTIATLLHMLVERAGKSLGYDDKVAEMWSLVSRDSLLFVQIRSSLSSAIPKARM